MCSMNVHAVCTSLTSGIKSEKLFEIQARKIARVTSFHYETLLLLEIIYRAQRQLKKREGPATTQHALATVASFLAFISNHTKGRCW